MSLDDLVFSSLEPGEGQRWSTWTTITPSERGPKPWPDWLITSASAFDTELGIVKSGKEADVFLLERGEPEDPTRSVLLAAKRYRGSETSDFHRSAQYQEGRRTRRSRDSRAVAKKSAYGRSFAAGQWAMAEFAALCELHGHGLPVPYPVQVHGTEILMEFIGRDGVAGPRLAQVRATAHELGSYAAQVVDILTILARAGYAHGDLSPYNLLVHDGRVIVIDLPQLVDVVSNPNGMTLLERDCVNVAEWFTRRGHPLDADDLFGRMAAEAFG